MKFLLDTHIFLWASIEPDNLSQNVLKIIENSANILFLSSASVWEISIKHKLGKLKILDKNLNFTTFIEESIKYMNLNELPIRIKHIYSLYNLPSIHKDPFDRILTSQALAEDLILITNDKIIKKYNVKTVW